MRPGARRLVDELAGLAFVVLTDVFLGAEAGRATAQATRSSSTRPSRSSSATSTRILETRQRSDGVWEACLA